jgi:hypothetical protein
VATWSGWTPVCTPVVVTRWLDPAHAPGFVALAARALRAG